MWDVLQHGYWHARGPEFLSERIMRIIEWCRLCGDLVFIGLGVFPLLIAAGRTYMWMRESARCEAAA
jgi:nitric oxide reductase subunit B